MKWIDVQTKEPELDVPIWLRFPDNACFIGMMTLGVSGDIAFVSCQDGASFNEDHWESWHKELDVDHSEPTHWAHLPDPRDAVKPPLKLGDLQFAEIMGIGTRLYHDIRRAFESVEEEMLEEAYLSKNEANVAKAVGFSMMAAEQMDIDDDKEFAVKVRDMMLVLSGEDMAE